MKEVDEAVAVRIAADGVTLDGDLIIPARAQGLVIFAHGSGSSRHSKRNKSVAESLRARGLATLLMDLLTRQEEAIDINTAELRFDMPLLAARVRSATEWARAAEETSELPIGLFGASTGGGAALMAAAERPDLVGAVVSRGGRPDLAEEMLPKVQAPTLLIVGELDRVVIKLNEQARSQMRALTELTIVPGATHLFEEPGTMEEVARLAGDWFVRYLK
jgi:putative phosphoribosyl transferase